MFMIDDERPVKGTMIGETANFTFLQVKACDYRDLLVAESSTKNPDPFF